MSSIGFEAPPNMGAMRRRGCDQSCLNNIAKYLCETSEHDAMGRSPPTLDQLSESNEPSNESTAATHVVTKEKKGCCTGQVSPIAATGNTSKDCCSGPADSATHGADKVKGSCGKDAVPVHSTVESNKGCCSGKEDSAPRKNQSCCNGEKQIVRSCKSQTTVTGCCGSESQPKSNSISTCAHSHGLGGVPRGEEQGSFAEASCASTGKTRCSDASPKCKSSAVPVSTRSCETECEPKDKSDPCCSSPEDVEKSTPSSCCDTSAIDEPALCSRKCCAVGPEKVTEAEPACSDHLQSAFERFESLIHLGRCLCRKMIEEFNFCCCCGQASPCASHEMGKKPSLKTNTKRESGRKNACRVSKTTSKSSSLCCDNANGALEEGTSDADSTCEDRCCTSKDAIEVSESDCEDTCCTQAKTAKGSEFVHAPPQIGDPNGIDIEKVAARDHVVLNVSGMTCTGCSRKMLNVLADIPGISNSQVTFVSGTAAFDFDRSQGHPDDILPLIEKRTGFQLSRVTDEHQELDVLLNAANAQAFEKEARVGLVSFDKLKAKDTYRIIYDPRVVGARDLLPNGSKLAPPAPNAANSEGRKRLINMAWATFISAVFTIPVVVLSWANTPVSQQTRQIVSLVLATVVQAIAVPEFYVGAVKSLIYSKVIEMDMLVVISITAAYGYSVIAFALVESGIKLEQESFFETSSLLITLVLVGRLMAAVARMRAVSAVSMSSLQTEKALLLHSNGQAEEIDARILHFGDTIRVMAHSSIVTDGIVTTGSGAVDESIFTGESVPVEKQPGDSVIAGTMTGPSSLDIRITRLPNANSISDIKTLVNNALTAKPRVQDLADKVASWFIPAVVAVALITFVIWVAVTITVRDENGGGAVGTAITYGIAVLAISCPCALGLAVPMVLVIAGGVAARSGVVIKGVDALERGYRATDVLFDKTGTLTMDNLAVERQYTSTIQNIPEDTAVGLAKSLVSGNNHPVSAAVDRFLEAQSPIGPEMRNIQSVPGSGITGDWNGRVIKAGNPHWLSVTTDPAIIEFLNRGLTAFCVSVDDELVLAFALSSTIRQEAPAVISALQRRNIRCHVVSGDNEKAVHAVATAVGINADNVLARCTPTQKKEYVEHLQSTGRVVLFCGDGTNDAVAVAQANVGMQIGTASDITKGLSDVTLLGGLDGILSFLNVSKRSFRRITFNFVWSAVYNVFAILLASGALVKFRIPPAYAGLGEIVSVLPVVLAAASLIWTKEW